MAILLPTGRSLRPAFLPIMANIWRLTSSAFARRSCRTPRLTIARVTRSRPKTESVRVMNARAIGGTRGEGDFLWIKRLNFQAAHSTLQGLRLGRNEQGDDV